VTTELETPLFSMENSYISGFCKDDVHYDDFGQPWVDYSDMHDIEYAYAGNDNVTNARSMPAPSPRDARSAMVIF
jgi:hypothetical protein